MSPRNWLGFLAVVFGLPLAFLPLALLPYALEALGLHPWLFIPIFVGLLLAALWAYETWTHKKLKTNMSERNNERENNTS